MTRYAQTEAVCRQCRKLYVASTGGEKSKFCTDKCRFRSYTAIGRVERECVRLRAENEYLRVLVARAGPLTTRGL